MCCVECNRVDETSACVVLVDSFFSLTVDALAVPNAVVGNADVILADGAVFHLLLVPTMLEHLLRIL